MSQEDKELLLKDLCGRLPYGVKLMVEGWDSDRGCEFTTIETLIGIDDRFIHTIWDKTGDKDKHSIIEPLSILDYKPYLRPMSSMTEAEKMELLCTVVGKDAVKYFQVLSDGSIDNTDAAHQDLNNFTMHWINFDTFNTTSYLDWLNAHHFDYRELIEKGLAIAVTEDNNPYKE